MEKLIVNNYEELASYLGKKLGESQWLEVSQERINLFADATLDHQWIHVDTARQQKKVPTRVLSHTDILRFRCCHTCGAKSLRCII